MIAFQFGRHDLLRRLHARELSLVRERIGASDAPHWREFTTAWTGDADATA